jgi:hypothetical protein
MKKILKFTAGICLIFGALSNSFASDWQWVHCSSKKLPKSINQICYGRDTPGEKSDNPIRRWYASWIQTALQSVAWTSNSKIYRTIINEYKKHPYNRNEKSQYEFHAEVAFGYVATNDASRFITSELNKKFFGGKLEVVMIDMHTYPVNPGIAYLTARSGVYRNYIYDLALLNYFAKNMDSHTGVLIDTDRLRQSIRNEFNKGISKNPDAMKKYALCIADHYLEPSSMNWPLNIHNVWIPLAEKKFSTAIYNINRVYGVGIKTTQANCKHP